MSIAKLCLFKGTQRIRTMEVGPFPILVGSAADAHLYVPDQDVAAHYARVYQQDGRLYIEALDPEQDISINGLRVHSSGFTKTDTVTLGLYNLRVQQDAEGAVASSPHSSQISIEAAAHLSDRILLSQDARAIKVLYKSSQVLARAENFSGAVQELLDFLHEELSVQRCTMLYSEHDEHDLTIYACNSAITETGDQMPVSNTLVGYVMNTGTAVLSTNAQEDDRFSGSTSIIKNKILSVICVPLAGHSKTQGVIYADSNGSLEPFNDTQLQVLTVVGQMLGAAMENARLSEKRLKQERLAAIGEAIAGTSHCMRNLLTGIVVSFEMMELGRENENWNGVDNAMGTLRRSIGRFRDQVENMLNFSRETDLVLQPVSVNDLVTESLNALEPIAKKYKVQLVFKQGAIEAIPLDATMIFRVMMNLVGNAIEACGTQGGSVTVSTFQNQLFTRFSISDTGGGIKPENIERIFDPFFTTKGGGGTGLGLAVSRRMIREHGGDIRVTSQPGEGSRFSVVFPHKTLIEHQAKSANVKQIAVMGS